MNYVVSLYSGCLKELIELNPFLRNKCPRARPLGNFFAISSGHNLALGQLQLLPYPSPY